ncbi:MAG: MBL fold metallo-hydrolase [Chloroflexi bacterium]|nr:MBL fold metallo-hydrolase [Chloroflexota bacterium]MBT4514905.1 MBL fold metallo-hydrolase [Chloroflexota bacterium]MBT5320387.1 MBL fold metallo-hydrolase [Chloroflexota bacterium]MBT6681613.1 MBL fold metallo-hydrolase [Chloroflexota bacterium]
MARSARIGRVEILNVEDYTPPPFNPQDFFPDVPLDAWDAHRAHHALDENGKFRVSFGAFALISDDFVIVVDTGIGPSVPEMFGGGEGRLVPRLREAGIQPDQVTAVLNTHLHPDHVGWNMTEGDPTFKNARYYFSAADYEWWTSEGVIEEAPQIPTQAQPLEALGLLELTGDGDEIAPGIRAIATPGHTPGHQSFLIDSDGAKGVVTGDVLHSRAQFTEPEWCAGFDMDKPTAIATRKALIERIMTEQMTVAASHLVVDSNIGHVIEVENRRYWQPL